MSLPSDYTDGSAAAKRREFRSATWWVASTMVGMLLLLVIGVSIRASRFEERTRQLERISRVGQGLIGYFNGYGEWPPDIARLAGVGVANADDVLGPRGRAGPPVFQFIPLPLAESRPANYREWVIAYGELDGRFLLTTVDARSYELPRAEWVRRIRATYEAIGRAGEIPATIR